jgi:hypothetical protein
MMVCASAAAACQPIEEDPVTPSDETYHVDDGVWPAVETRENGNVVPYISSMPSSYWNVTGVIWSSTQNQLDKDSATGTGLRNHVLFQSLVGLSNRALQEGTNDIVLWGYSSSEGASYKVAHDWLDAQDIRCLGEVNPLQLALKGENEEGSLRKLIEGYVLTDLEGNQESISVATVAAHVFNAIIVDEVDEHYFKDAGFKMLYDCRKKNLKDAWTAFKDKCNNQALIMIPVWMGELRGYAIEHGLFCFNILPEREFKGKTNMILFREVNGWLAPNSPIYGASNYDEGETDLVISRFGNNWVPLDWGYNTGITSLCYPERKKSVKYGGYNPLAIDYSITDDYDFVNFYLSDGDNVQWELKDFYGEWYNNKYAQSTKTAFGMSVGQLAMFNPDWLQKLFNEQKRGCSVFDRGSYYFIDYLGEKKNRQEVLWQMAQETAMQMRAANVRILATVSWDSTDSKASREGYQAMIDANDQLDAIFTIAYNPYPDSSEDIQWFSNRNGIDIPVIRTTYAIWNLGDHNDLDQGTPAYIAQKLNQHKNQFNLICLHSWSKFRDIGTSPNTLGENIPNQDDYSFGACIHSSGAAELCIKRLDDKFKVVSLEELVWRIRMKYRPDQTKQLLGLK